jgi:D-lactate dehydrogenase
MKVLAYGYRFDEEQGFERFTKEIGVEAELLTENFNDGNLERASGYEAIAVTAMAKLNRENLRRLSEIGVKYIASRSIGFNNVDLAACKEFGIKFSNAPYSPHSVADYAAMLILMLLRRYKVIERRAAAQDYDFRGIQGRELHNLTVGIVGTGRIGRTVMEDLSGFGPKFIAYDLYPNDALRDKVEYVELDELFARADVITLHAPLQESSYHMVNAESIAKMKDGVVIINTARGELVDTAALIDGLESGKIGGAGLDVIEGEHSYTFADHRNDIIVCRERAVLEAMQNVILTGHFAFYTDQAIDDQIRIVLESLKEFVEKGTSANQIV